MAAGCPILSAAKGGSEKPAGGNSEIRSHVLCAGNRTAKQNLMTGVTENYSYGNIYQLTQVLQGATTTESYTYDAVGNRLSSLTSALNQYNNSNELTSDSTFTYQYDHNGNLTSKSDSNGNTTAYAW